MIDRWDFLDICIIFLSSILHLYCWRKWKWSFAETDMINDIRKLKQRKWPLFMLQTCNWSRHINYHQRRHENDGQFSLSGTIANSFCYTNKTPTFYPSKQLKIIYTTYFLAFGNLRCKAFLSSKEITQCNTGETVLYVPVNSKTAHHPPPPPHSRTLSNSPLYC